LSPVLGQHFLTDRRILERIVDALEPEPSDRVLEIGAGRGTLTRVLAEHVGQVVAIEKDSRLAAKLRDEGRGTGGEFQVVAGDALRLDWHALLSPTHPSSLVPRPFKVVGNIPYAITSPLIDKALTPPLPERIVFLIQAEVAERLAAPPGSKVYGALTVGVQATCQVEKLFSVAASAFRPPPRVRSTLIRLRPLSRPLISVADAPAFRTFVTACFGLRRKQLVNVLRAVTGRTAESVTAWLSTRGIDATQRPETLRPDQFIQLFHWG
jgi:16S rRNA (adenine1518-N6/adenine1519-N6)-dimethyltransferase